MALKNTLRRASRERFHVTYLRPIVFLVRHLERCVLPLLVAAAGPLPSHPHSDGCLVERIFRGIRGSFVYKDVQSVACSLCKGRADTRFLGQLQYST